MLWLAERQRSVLRSPHDRCRLEPSGPPPPDGSFRDSINPLRQASSPLSFYPVEPAEFIPHSGATIRFLNIGKIRRGRRLNSTGSAGGILSHMQSPTKESLS